MKVQLSVLRKIVREALVDHMRFPKGDNSRDNVDDSDSEDSMLKGYIEEITEDNIGARQRSAARLQPVCLSVRI